MGQFEVGWPEDSRRIIKGKLVGGTREKFSVKATVSKTLSTGSVTSG
jgi:hypothetical protein